jgi:alpha-2-macroglobulin
MESGPVAGRTVMSAGGAEQAFSWSGQPAGGAVPLVAPAGPAPEFRARHEGSGRPWLTLQSWAAVPLRAPLAAGYRLSRQVEAVQQQRPGVFSRGDVLRVTLTIEVQQDLGWVALADPIPAGATLLGSGLGRDSAIQSAGGGRGGTAWPVYEERAADAYKAYFEGLPRGRHVVRYSVRLNSAGRFGLPPSRVEAMYAPENFAELPLAPVEVQP